MKHQNNIEHVSVRDIMAVRFGQYIQDYPDVIAEVLQIEFPDDVTSDAGRIAFIMSSVLLHKIDAKGIENPSCAVKDMVEEAKLFGWPYTNDESDAMAGYAIAACDFWDGRYSDRLSILSRMLMHGSESVFRELRESIGDLHAAMDAQRARCAANTIPDRAMYHGDGGCDDKK